MSRHLFKLARAGAPAAILTAALAVPALADDGVSADTVVATVGDVEITIGHVLVARDELPEQFRQLPPETLFQPIVTQLVEQTALMMTGADDIATRDRLRAEHQRRSIISNAVLDQATRGAVTEDSIAAAYDSFVAEFEAVEDPMTEFNASHIIVGTEEEAQALRAELDEGADFAELAREHSTDGAAQGGGDLGWFGPGMMIAEFEQAVAAMEVGAIDGPLETQFGWHLIQLNDTRIATAPALEDVREQIIQEIRREVAEAAVADALDAVEVSRSDDAIDPSVLLDPGLLDD